VTSKDAPTNPALPPTGEVWFDPEGMRVPDHPATTSLLALDNLSAGYPGRTVIARLSLRLSRGSFTGLIGGNGSGKTTLLKTIAGILRPLAGRVQFQPIDDRAPVIGYVPQREAFDSIYPLSAADVTAMGVQGRLKAGQSPRATERAAIERALEQCGAQDFVNEPFAQLSGGQKQRVLIARALAAEPDLLLLDEPTAGIDAAAVSAVCELLDRLHRQGMTILMVNHEIEIVRRLARDVLWVRREGITHGPVEELLDARRATELLEIKLG
jgi:ABC-type Mn2+/Zn2+ transport system ATPase subunit